MALFMLLVGCAGENAQAKVCEDICMELTVGCAFEAYPNYGSCEQGCMFEAEKGEDMEAELECLEAAQCDTFAVIDCENTTW
jgi:hypothetical protein